MKLTALLFVMMCLACIAKPRAPRFGPVQVIALQKSLIGNVCDRAIDRRRICSQPGVTNFGLISSIALVYSDCADQERRWERESTAQRSAAQKALGNADSCLIDINAPVKH